MRPDLGFLGSKGLIYPRSCGKKFMKFDPIDMKI